MMHKGTFGAVFQNIPEYCWSGTFPMPVNMHFNITFLGLFLSRAHSEYILPHKPGYEHPWFHK